MSMVRKMQAVIKLGAVPQYGPASVRKLIANLERQETSLEYLTEFSEQDLIEVGMSDDQARVFMETDAIDSAERLTDSGVSLLVSSDEDAPQQFTNSRLTPWFFYYGNPSIMTGESIGFSGSRDASSEAILVTTEIAAAASGRDWLVISGGARGVDIAAHLAALDAGGSTAVILAQGISTWKLPEELDQAKILVVSEFMPLDDWGSYRAMQRNKSIIHLSDRLVIPQAGDRGGTKNAGEYALKQGHPTWVVDLGDEYTGNCALIQKGGRPFTWTGDPAALEEMILTESPPGSAQQPLF